MESIKDAANRKMQQGSNMKKKANSDNGYKHSEVADGNLLVSPGNKLGKDELTLIFSFNSYWITTTDLLNFRRVNKNWRDSATTVLLRRDACKVAAEANPRSIQTKDDDGDDGDVASNEDESFIDPHRDKKKPLRTLTQLTEIISKSSKFPASSFEIHTPLNNSKDYADYPDLIEFLNIHGKKIKTLCPYGYISRDLVMDICFTYAPELECLDLSKAKVEEAAVPSNDRGEEDSSRASKWSSRILPFKSLILPDPWKDQDSVESDIVNSLLSSTSKILNLTDVTLSMLDHILKEGKGNLVKSFVFKDWKLSSSTISPLLKTFCDLSPKLSSITLVEFGSHGLDPRLAAAVNSIIGSSRISLQFLELSYNMEQELGKIKIPPMPNLKKLTLMGNPSDFGPEDLIPPVEKLPLSFVFHDEFSASGYKYFPNLLSFKLDLGTSRSIASPDSYICLFPKNSCSTVDDLEICSNGFDNQQNVELDYTVLSGFFLNVRVLKVCSGEISNLSGTLWKMCSLELIVIEISKSPADVSLVHFVDQFFTGFSIDMCRKLQTEELPKEMENPVSLKFLQMKPSIRDLQNVKEFKLEFSDDFSGQFASHVTGEYAFAKMPQTKFIVSYDTDKIARSGDKGNVVRDEDQFGQSDSDEKNDELDKFEEMCFGPIKPYVQIIRGKEHC